MEQTKNERPVHLPVYEGPLDLLLALIAKNEIDIYDIPIKLIAEQYMAYIYELNAFNIEVATEFVVMAAQLIEIKSKMLLPPEPSDGEEEGIDPRDQLVARLIEYGTFKRISEYLAISERGYGRMISKDPSFYEDLYLKDEQNLKLTAEMLVRAMNNVILKRKLRLVREAGLVLEHENYSVELVMGEIYAQLENQNKLRFSQIIDGRESRSYLVAVFMALLEMYKLNAITLTQRDNFSDIVIEKGSGAYGGDESEYGIESEGDN